MTAFDVIVTAAVVTNGLLAGLFFAFTCAVSPALGRLDDRSYVAAFRSINTVILNRWFLPVFFLAPAAAIAAAVVAALARHPSFWWTVVAAACSTFTFVITVAANVPLNQALDAAPGTTSTQYEQARSAFEAAWNRWNLARTLTSVGALVLLACATTG